MLLSFLYVTCVRPYHDMRILPASLAAFMAVSISSEPLISSTMFLKPLYLPRYLDLCHRPDYKGRQAKRLYCPHARDEIMRGYIAVLRPLNCLMAGFAVFIGARIAASNVSGAGLLLAVAAAFLICGAGNTVNDYFDYDIDRVNRPYRPLPSGLITRGGAHRYALLLFTAGVALSAFINLPAMLLALFNTALLYLYGAAIKREGGFTKNLTVSYLVASPFLFGGLVAENPRPTLLLVFIALLINTAREIVKDIEDYEGDASVLETLPVKYGFKASGAIAMILLAATILLSPLPYTMGFAGFLYTPFIVAGDILLLRSMKDLLRSPAEKASSAQRHIKKAMLLALIGFFVGSL
ncbi:MAG: digeranylgeranylglyceryl phosphate synthase [Methanobacteriota archaeon]|nr:MAG: digeranylgeranylglyceryl phosphate synthase [Euryarchaeota archaeon]